MEPILSQTEWESLHLNGYRVDNLLATGAFSRVYHGWIPHPNEPQQLAIKVVDLKTPPRFLARELTILRAVQHPYIISLHSVFVDGGKCFIVTHFAEAGDLLDFLIQNGPTTEETAKLWIRQMAEAVSYLHERDIVHRDIKCENVLLTQDHHVKLADFGFARFLLEGQLSRGKSETYCGSLSYVAPEIIRQRPYFAKPADVWSMGVVLFIILNAQVPFEATEPTDIYRLQIRRNFKHSHVVRKRLSHSCKTLIRHVLHPNYKRRITVQNILDSQWLTGRPEQAKNTPEISIYIP